LCHAASGADELVEIPCDFLSPFVGGCAQFPRVRSLGVVRKLVIDAQFFLSIRLPPDHDEKSIAHLLYIDEGKSVVPSVTIPQEVADCVSENRSARWMRHNKSHTRALVPEP
jgi:hypothetical protein